MPRFRHLAFGPAVAVAALVSQCAPAPTPPPARPYHPPQGHLASPTSYVCTYSVDWQNAAGLPIAYIRYRPSGASTYRETARVNVNTLSANGGLTISAYSATGFNPAVCADVRA